MKYTKVPTDTFSTMTLNAGILLSAFTASDGSFNTEDILGATTGGIAFSDAPEFQDNGEGIDNVKKNTKELKEISDRVITASGTFVAMRKTTAKLLATAADISGNKITPRDKLKDEDFTDIWIVADYSDVNDGQNAGFIALHLMNVLSTGGFKLQTADKGKGNFAFEFTAHYSIANDDVPYEIYIQDGE